MLGLTSSQINITKNLKECKLLRIEIIKQEVMMVRAKINKESRTKIQRKIVRFKKEMNTIENKRMTQNMNNNQTNYFKLYH